MAAPMMRRLDFGRRLLVAVGWIGVGVCAVGQAPNAPQPVFAVATIRPTPADGRMMMMPNGSAESFNARMATVESMIGFAYDIPYSQTMSLSPKAFFNPSSPNLIGGPGWVHSDHYDLTAKADDATIEAWNKLPAAQQKEQLRKMLQTLLADRFKLVMRRETREMPVWTLVVAKGGSKLTAAPPFPPNDPSGPYRSPWKRDSGMLEGNGVTVEALTRMLWGMREIESRKVLDRTGLEGTYNFTLKWTSDEDAAGGNGPSLFTAIQEQLGLKLESTKAPLDVLVIDHVERPSEN
jgi:uncharacterized protein (TIGR03435 family)